VEEEKEKDQVGEGKGEKDVSWGAALLATVVRRAGPGLLSRLHTVCRLCWMSPTTWCRRSWPLLRWTDYYFAATNKSGLGWMVVVEVEEEEEEVVVVVVVVVVVAFWRPTRSAALCSVARWAVASGGPQRGARMVGAADGRLEFFLW
jgi:hypothetical protein